MMTPDRTGSPPVPSLRSLLDALPHRPPFLFVDEIVEVDAGRIITRTLADPKADFFRGHYPGHPVMPGVLLCECCFQAGALLIAHRTGGWSWSDGMPVLTRINEARFKHIVRPGDMLQAEVTLDDELERAFVLTGRLTVGDKLALRVGFACMLATTDSGV
jgi:3-hydroxyacyl-[acyl-carrier-protein] dehydratase